VREEEQPRLCFDARIQRRERPPAVHGRRAELNRVKLTPIHVACIQARQDAAARGEHVADPLLGRVGRLAIREGEG